MKFARPRPPDVEIDFTEPLAMRTLEEVVQYRTVRVREVFKAQVDWLCKHGLVDVVSYLWEHGTMNLHGYVVAATPKGRALFPKLATLRAVRR